MWKENVGYLDKLQGKLHLVVGNHDHTRTRKHPRWLSVSPFEELKDEHFTLIVLCHYALETWNRSHYGTVHLHGHSHGSLPSRGRRLDVGVDAWDFRPVSLETLRVHPTLAANPHLCDHHRPV
jgi:calcineurin-like phosphoesterase family protein